MSTTSSRDFLTVGQRLADNSDKNATSFRLPSRAGSHSASSSIVNRSNQNAASNQNLSYTSKDYESKNPKKKLPIFEDNAISASNATIRMLAESERLSRDEMTQEQAFSRQAYREQCQVAFSGQHERMDKHNHTRSHTESKNSEQKKAMLNTQNKAKNEYKTGGNIKSLYNATRQEKVMNGDIFTSLRKPRRSEKTKSKTEENGVTKANVVEKVNVKKAMVHKPKSDQAIHNTRKRINNKTDVNIVMEDGHKGRVKSGIKDTADYMRENYLRLRPRSVKFDDEEEEGDKVSFLSGESIPKWFFASATNSRHSSASLWNFSKMEAHLEDNSMQSSFDEDDWMPIGQEAMTLPDIHNKWSHGRRKVAGNTLPLQSDLDKYLHFLRSEKGLNHAFTNYIGAVIPGKYRSGGPMSRPKENYVPVYARQKTRFGTDALQQIQQQSSAEAIMQQQQEVNETHTKLKAMLTK